MKVNIYGIINPITNEFFNKQIWNNIYKYIKCNCPYNYKGYIIKRII